MNKYFFEGKNYDDAIKNATNELNTQESDLIVNIVEEKKGILKKSTKIEIVSINDLINYLKEEIKELVSLITSNKYSAIMYYYQNLIEEILNEYKETNNINTDKMKLASQILETYYGKLYGIKYFYNV